MDPEFLILSRMVGLDGQNQELAPASNYVYSLGNQGKESSTLEPVSEGWLGGV